MSYYTDGILISRVDATDLGLLVMAQAARADRPVQCYVAGELVDWQRPQGGQVRFVLPRSGAAEAIVLLAVDAGDERCDYSAEALAAAGLVADRIEVLFRRDLLDGRRPGDVWRVRRSRPGEAEAALRVYEGPVFRGGRGCTGWGFDWGGGGWGRGGSNAPGWGVTWGFTWGYGIDFLSCRTEPLARGRYAVRVETADAHGNVAEAVETFVTIDAPARPAEGLAVASYTKDTDTLVLTMAPSADIA